MNRKSKARSFGRDSLQSRSSVSGASATKIPRSTPLLHSTRKVLPASSSKKSSGRSSYFGMSDHHVMKDTRPLGEKPYMKKCILELLAFLSDMNYPYPLSVKMLSPPTNKEYFRIFEFVYCLISPHYKMVARPDEEVTKILYDLSYPFTLSKSTLSNIGTMSAWPHALGAVDWLVNVAKYNISKEQRGTFEILSKGVNTQEVMSDYLKETYTAFMHGRDTPYTDIDTQLEKRLEEMNREQRSEVEGLRTKLKQSKARKEELRKEKEELEESEKSLITMQNDEESFQKYFEEFGEYRTYLENRNKQLEEKLGELTKQAADLEAENREIRSTISGQELSVADVQKHGIIKDQMEASIKTTEERCKHLESQSFEKQIERSKMIAKLGSQIAEYTQLCRDLQLIPESAANAKGVDFGLKTDHAEIDQNADKLLTEIRPLLMNMKSEFLSARGKLQHDLTNSATVMEQLNEQVSDQGRMKSSLQGQLDKLREEDDKQSSEYGRLEKRQSADVQRVKDEIEQLETVNSVSVEDVDARLKAMTEKVEETVLRTMKEKDDFMDMLLDMGEKVLEQRAKMEDELREYNNNIKAAKEMYLPRLTKVQENLEEIDARFEQHEKRLNELMKDLPEAD